MNKIKGFASYFRYVSGKSKEIVGWKVYQDGLNLIGKDDRGEYRTSLESE